ncbi:hypothetical protein [uncultured Chryseobacterium sp.]|uniref:hypothetical protein n=1 Tax=uncultured Chryseobacterium sp. TaxID=259322 RepID=UPI0025D05B9C|nr:hypothetical protein [uncultured Chryseobacterium sp.]
MNYNVFLLLDIIKKNGNVKKLIHNGLDFTEIADLTKKLIELDLISYEDKKVQISQKGEDIYLKLEKKYKIKEKNKWIEEENNSKIEKISKDFIYLPKLNELLF